MKRIAVDVQAAFYANGQPKPQRFRFVNEDGSESIIKVDRILRRDKTNIAGCCMLCYRCETSQNGVMIPIDLRYEADTFKWYLYI